MRDNAAVAGQAFVSPLTLPLLLIGSFPLPLYGPGTWWTGVRGHGGRVLLALSLGRGLGEGAENITEVHSRGAA